MIFRIIIVWLPFSAFGNKKKTGRSRGASVGQGLMAYQGLSGLKKEVGLYRENTGN